MGVDTDSLRSSFQHIAHPEVFVDDSNQRFVLFFQAKAQPDQVGDSGNTVPQVHGRFVATSPYGLNFNDPNTGGGVAGYGPVAMTDDGLNRDMLIASNYMRVFKHNGGWYSVSKRGVLEKAPDLAAPFTPNANVRLKAWTLQTRRHRFLLMMFLAINPRQMQV